MLLAAQGRRSSSAPAKSARPAVSQRLPLGIRVVCRHVGHPAEKRCSDCSGEQGDGHRPGTVTNSDNQGLGNRGQRRHDEREWWRRDHPACHRLFSLAVLVLGSGIAALGTTFLPVLRRAVQFSARVIISVVAVGTALRSRQESGRNSTCGMSVRLAGCRPERSRDGLGSTHH